MQRRQRSEIEAVIKKMQDQIDETARKVEQQRKAVSRKRRDRAAKEEKINTWKGECQKYMPGQVPKIHGKAARAYISDFPVQDSISKPNSE